MRRARAGEDGDGSGVLRRALLGLAVVGLAGTALELVMLRHWTSPSQVIPWLAVGLMAVALGLLVARPSPGRVRVVRILAGAIMLVAAYGVFAHVHGNYEAGPLDLRYTDRWETMSQVSRWWAAATESVGPSPPLAPGALALAALCVLFATLRHPAMARSAAGAARPAINPAGTPSSG